MHDACGICLLYISEVCSHKVNHAASSTLLHYVATHYYIHVMHDSAPVIVQIYISRKEKHSLCIHSEMSANCKIFWLH